MAVEGTTRLHVRRHDGEHAGHPRESSRLSTGVQPEAGLGFPIARIGVITSLASGAVLDLGFCRYAGKGQGEVSLLRRLWDVLRRGDLLLADSLLSNWTGIVLLQEQGVDLVSRLNKAHRKADFRRGTRLGEDDHIVRWRKPTSIRSVDRQTYHSLPEYVTIREARFRVEQPGFRTKAVVVVATLLDPVKTTKNDLAVLYRARWNNELNLRSIKSTMKMDVLRCKTPELVHKEVGTHILAYNLIRTVMAQAATRRCGAAIDQLQSCDTNVGSVSAADRLPRMPQRLPPGQSLPAVAKRRRHSSRRRST